MEKGLVTTKCGLQGKGITISLWSSDITCENCKPTSQEDQIEWS